MKARFLILFFLFLLSGLSISAQQVATTDFEKNFDRRRGTLKLEKFQKDREMAPGSPFRFEYLYYVDQNGKLAKIRVIERENRPEASLKVDDYFFIDGDLRLVRLYFFTNSSRLAALNDGRIVPMLSGEHIELKDKKLLRWNALAREVASTDARWADKQAAVLVYAQAEINIYNEFKKPKQ